MTAFILQHGLNCLRQKKVSYLSISDAVMPRTDNPEHNNKTNPVTEDESSMSAFNYNLAPRKWAASTTSSEEQKYVKYAIKALKLNTETTNRLRGAWEYEGENWSYATKSKQMTQSRTGLLHAMWQEEEEKRWMDWCSTDAITCRKRKLSATG